MLRVTARPRSYVRVAGPDARDYLQRMVSNDVEALAVGDSCEALLLTPKARIVAPLRVWRRGEEDFLLLTEPDLGEVVRAHLIRMRLRARAEVELEQHASYVVVGPSADDEEGIESHDYAEPAREVLDRKPELPPIADEELEVLRIKARTPRWGRELDDRVLPAEAGLDERAISFTKGCYPGQEPVARLRHRGHANRALRVLEVEEEVAPGAELRYEGKAVGRVTSVARGLALAYVRVEVPDDAEVEVEGAVARPLR